MNTCLFLSVPQNAADCCHNAAASRKIHFLVLSMIPRGVDLSSFILFSMVRISKNMAMTSDLTVSGNPLCYLTFCFPFCLLPPVLPVVWVMVGQGNKSDWLDFTTCPTEGEYLVRCLYLSLGSLGSFSFFAFLPSCFSKAIKWLTCVLASQMLGKNCGRQNSLFIFYFRVFGGVLHILILVTFT